jgi:hypothetical protein
MVKAWEMAADREPLLDLGLMPVSAAYMEVRTPKNNGTH